MDGLSTIGTILKMGAQSSSLTEVPDLQDFPDLMGAPDKIETTDHEKYVPHLYSRPEGSRRYGVQLFVFRHGGEFELRHPEDRTGFRRYTVFPAGVPGQPGFAWQGKVTLSVPARASVKRCSSRRISRRPSEITEIETE